MTSHASHTYVTTHLTSHNLENITHDLTRDYYKDDLTKDLTRNLTNLTRFNTCRTHELKYDLTQATSYMSSHMISEHDTTNGLTIMTSQTNTFLNMTSHRPYKTSQF